MSKIKGDRVKSEPAITLVSRTLSFNTEDGGLPATVRVNGVAFYPEDEGREPEVLPAQIGEFTIDPLESAISNIVREAQDAQGLTLTILQDQLAELCKIQREKLGQ